MMKSMLICFLAVASQQTLPTLAALATKSAASSNKLAVEFSSQFKFLEPIQIFAAKHDETEVDKEEDAEDARSKMDAKALAEEGNKQKELVKLWFTWGFWRLLVACATVLLIFTELIFSLAFKLMGRTLMVASVCYFVQNFCFLLTALAFATPGSAGATLCLILPVILCAISLLIVLGTIGWTYEGKPSRSIEFLQRDLTYVFKPVSMFFLVFLLVQGLIDSSGADWGSVAMFASFMALGVAFAVSGVLTDMFSYLFIRGHDYFQEDEYIMNDGDLLLIKNVFWCYTLAYSPSTRSDIYIPNGQLAGNAINNRSRDNARAFEIDLDIPVAKSQKIVSDVMALLKKSEESGFTSITGLKFEGQVDAAKSQIYVTAMDPGGDTCSMKIKLAAKYYFSKPPQWKMDTPEPEAVKRQLAWQAGWNYQVESLLLEMKKIITA